MSNIPTDERCVRCGLLKDEHDNPAEFVALTDPLVIDGRTIQAGKGLMALLKSKNNEIERLRTALRYWFPDETMIPEGHEVAWNEHVTLIPEHRLRDDVTPPL